ncbi:unnamed protein product [Nezara viridula]|uniref:Bardet-Biedl syndrome 2 protein homolog n=1 Tax=Nezara viridula TaxID=85310 RepID=A0A9P0MP38_NEZVI|nr:unnamed protein product [Nezara viridula]
MTVPLFTIQLKQRMLPGRVTMGKFDGSHSCITAATTGDKVFVHSPHLKERELSMLNVNQSVTSICAGKLNPNEEKDILVIGTKTTVLAYHVENNTDLFYKEVPDGANSICIGKIGNINTPLAIIGGNCSIQGFDWQGNDPYWTVTGDNVRSISLLDLDQDGDNELIVGSDDFELRVFKQDALIHEVTETEAITCLVPLRDHKFAYCLSNGTVGVYDKYTRVWRVKSKNAPVCLSSYDINGDGIPELIIGWSNGKVDARNIRTGEVVFHDILSHGIAGIVIGDYTMSGKPQLIVCSTHGEIRGYDQTSITKNIVQHGDLVRELLSKKQTLLTELKNYAGDPSGTGIPANTRLLAEINVSTGSKQLQSGHVLVSLSTNNLMVIRAAAIFAEGIFEGETLVIHPKPEQVSSQLEIPLIIPKDTPLDIHIKLETWQNQNFLVGSNSEERGGEGPSSADWSVSLTCLRDNSSLQMKVESGIMTIATPHMSIAADIVQSIAQTFNMDVVQSFAEFPFVYEQLRETFVHIEELQQNASKMSATIADTSNLIRALIVQIGKIKGEIAGLCRNALASNNVNALIRIIKTGEA